MLAVSVNPRRKEDTSDKDRALRAMWTRILRRCPIQSEDAEKQNQPGNSWRIMSINRGLSVANSNSQIFEKLFTSHFASQAKNKLRKFNG